MFYMFKLQKVRIWNIQRLLSLFLTKLTMTNPKIEYSRSKKKNKKKRRLNSKGGVSVLIEQYNSTN